MVLSFKEIFSNIIEGWVKEESNAVLSKIIIKTKVWGKYV